MDGLGPDKIRHFLAPRRIAFIGASDSSTFSRLGFANAQASSGVSQTYLVNPRSRNVHDQPTFGSCVEIGEQIDLAMVMVRSDLVTDALRDAAAAGAQGAVVLSSGFAEVGGGGHQLQREMTELAQELGLVVLGPNSLGFVNVTAGIAAMTIGEPPMRGGNVALISQSGASCGAMKDFAALSGVDLAYVITVGNEACLTAGHLIDALVDDESTRAMAVFMETIKEPEVFARAAVRARDAGKALVVLKAGRSELAASIAASHTGSLVGNDRVVDAVFDELGVIRVDTIEDMIITAGLAAKTGPLEGSGVGVVSMSGGACDIAADLAEQAGVELSPLEETTVKALEDQLSDLATPRNPLDITGAAVKQPELWTIGLREVGSDSAVSLLLAVHNLPLGDNDTPFYGQQYINAIGMGMAAPPIPAVFVTQVTQPIGGRAKRALQEAGITTVIPGLQFAIRASAALVKWSRHRDFPVTVVDPGSSLPSVVYDSDRPYNEAETAGLLSAFNVPFVPFEHVRSAEQVASAASRLGQELVVKVVSAEIQHKSDVGGVALGVAQDSVGAAFERVVSSAQLHGIVDGALIAPMRRGGVELLVGITRDPDWGLMLSVGSGGVLVELLGDVETARLPVTRDRLSQMLSCLGCWPLLNGFRGGKPANIERLINVIQAVGDAAMAIGEDLESLEINPLRVDGDVVEALDALINWRRKDET